jgi:hypothetical protein
MRSILKRLSRRHSTAVAYLALFAALGGSAYAAVTVTGKDIMNGTITGKDVKNRSLGTNKLSAKATSADRPARPGRAPRPEGRSRTDGRSWAKGRSWTEGRDRPRRAAGARWA